MTMKMGEMGEVGGAGEMGFPTSTTSPLKPAIHFIAVLEEYTEETCRIIEEAGGINTELFNAYPSMPGVYGSATDSFDPKRHRVKTNLTPGTRMRRATAAIKTHKVQVADTIPFIIEVHDLLSDTFNELLTSGGVVQVHGGRLKLAVANPDNGIFLVDEQGQAVKLSNIVENKPARLIAMLPAGLPAGSYTLEVRTSLSASNKEGNKDVENGKIRSGINRSNRLTCMQEHTTPLRGSAPFPCMGVRCGNIATVRGHCQLSIIHLQPHGSRGVSHTPTLHFTPALSKK